MSPKFIINQENHPRKGFYASDFGKLGFDLYHSFKNTPITNPMEWNSTLKMGAGKGVELQMVRVLKDSGIIPLDWDQEKEGTSEMVRDGVKIRMKLDAIVGPQINQDGAEMIARDDELEVGAPIEIKSINNKNSQDINDYENSNPRKNYVGQLAIYMDFLGCETGYLFVATVDGLHHFWLTCKKTGDGVYVCGKVKVDLKKEYSRWREIYYQNIMTDTEPSALEAGRYKIPVEEIDWSKQSIYSIAKARNGLRVIGDEDSWRILYSPWKDLIIKKQGAEIGYSEKEIEFIKKATAGYSSKKKS